MISVISKSELGSCTVSQHISIFHTNFIFFLSSGGKYFRILTGDELNLLIALDIMNLLTVLIVLIQDEGKLHGSRQP